VARYRCELPASCRPVAAWLARDRNCPATIRTLSTQGLSLVLDRRFEAGAGLAVELPASDNRGVETLLVKVVQVDPRSGGQWRLRCAFITELGEDTVLALVGPDAAQRPQDAGSHGSRAAVGRWNSRLGELLSWAFPRDSRSGLGGRPALLLAAMLGLGVTMGVLVRLLR
jgi:hypothetical protein